MNLLLLGALVFFSQQQETSSNVVLKSDSFTLKAEAIDSKPTGFGIVYSIKKLHQRQSSKIP